MPKAEVGSTKYLANKMKAKGLQRLRWYCQICGKQCRDENGFKQHTQSEGHVRAMLLVGEDPKKYIEQYSRDFQRDFLQLLKTSHGEKKVHMNNFYQEYIRDKEHIHMNATKWPSLTEFAKHLGREGICRVEEGDRGLEIQWIDDSPEAVRRREDIKRKEKLAKGDEDTEARMLEAQIQRAREEAERKEKLEQERRETASDAKSEEVAVEPVKVSLSLGAKAIPKQKQKELTSADQPGDAAVAITTFSTEDNAASELSTGQSTAKDDDTPEQGHSSGAPATAPVMPLSMSLSAAGNKPKHVNPLMKKNPLSSKSKSSLASQPEKKMSNAERIMREELERKRKAEERFSGAGKKAKMDGS